MMNKQAEKYGWILLGLFFLLMGCSQEDDFAEDNETKELPVMFNLLPSGVLSTKAMEDNKPDGGVPAASVREVYVDRVRLLVYKRQMGEYADNEEGFYLDKQGNPNLILHCIKQNQFPFFIARGVIQVSKGYEYRVTALGYSEEKEEQNLFHFKGDRFDHTQLNLTDQKEYKTPELFYGVPTIPGDKGPDSTFTYNDVDKEAGSKQLEGWLYRGIAGIEVNLSMKEVTDVKKIELLADSVHTSVGMQRYDNFHTPFNKVKDGAYNHYVLAVASLPEGQTTFEDDSVHLRYANLLPVCTSLSLRVTKTDGKVHNTTLRLRETSVTPSESPALRSLPDDGGNGTGIIPDNPVTPDPEQPEKPEDNPFRVCFKRNNYYRITGDYKKLTLMRYVLQVSVNPNWEGSINLPLDKS